MRCRRAEGGLQREAARTRSGLAPGGRGRRFPRSRRAGGKRQPPLPWAPPGTVPRRGSPNPLPRPSAATGGSSSGAWREGGAAGPGGNRRSRPLLAFFFFFFFHFIFILFPPPLLPFPPSPSPPTPLPRRFPTPLSPLPLGLRTPRSARYSRRPGAVPRASPPAGLKLPGPGWCKQPPHMLGPFLRIGSAAAFPCTPPPGPRCPGEGRKGGGSGAPSFSPFFSFSFPCRRFLPEARAFKRPLGDLPF